MFFKGGKPFCFKSVRIVRMSSCQIVNFVNECSAFLLDEIKKWLFSIIFKTKQIILILIQACALVGNVLAWSHTYVFQSCHTQLRTDQAVQYHSRIAAADCSPAPPITDVLTSRVLDSSFVLPTPVTSHVTPW